MLSNYSSKINLIDTLITTNAALIKFLEQFEDAKTNFWIYYFKEDREHCIENDLYRDREVKSQETIKNLLLEGIDLEALQLKFPKFQFVIEEKEVYKMKDWEKFAALNKIQLSKLEDPPYKQPNEKRYLVSDYWLTSGETRSYDEDWNDSWSSSSYCNDPLSFQELDDVLFKLCPGISYLQAKKITQLVEIESYTEHDYYSNYNKQHHTIDVEKLYDLLLEMELIESIN